MAGRKISYHKKGIEIWMPPSPFGSKLFLAHQIFIYLFVIISIIINGPGDQNSG